MNQESLSYTLTQISYLVSNLNKKNFSSNCRQIAQFVKEFGLEADRHLLRCLFSSIDFGDATQVSKNSLQARLLSTELASLLNKSSLVSNICFAVDNCFAQQKSLKPSQNLFNQITKAINCSPIQEVSIALALLHSKNADIVKLAEQHVKISLPNLIQSYIELDTARPNQEGSLNDTSPELLQYILSLISHGKHNNFGLTDTVYNKFIVQLCRDFPRDRVPLILAPLLYTEDSEISADCVISNTQSILKSGIMDTSWTSLVLDIGYAFTASIEECKNHLLKVGGREINAQDVAKIVGAMCVTHANLSESSINLPTPNTFWPGQSGEAGKEKPPNSQTAPTTTATENTTWKPDIFVQTLKDVAPNLSWKDVCHALDYPEFVLKDRAGLNLLLTIIRMGMQLNGAAQAFPAECLYRHWTNVEGQLSVINLILKNPDLFSFADYIFNSVSVELLKTPPETDNKEIASWKSLHLVDVLLYIAENGLYVPVMDIFKIPINACPDILFMALLQINPPVTVLRQELFSTLIPIFLGNHPNSGAILHHAWNSNNFNPSLRHIIMISMSEWHLRGENDQSRLSRILDVAQDLKALSNLLNARSFIFVIDLACLASRREYLKLEKWLADKIREHGEPFVQAIIKFLQRRCPQIMGAKIPEDKMPKSAQLPNETLNTMLTCLQGCIGNVSPELAEVIVTMATHCAILLNNSRQQQQQQPPPQQPPGVGVLRPHRGLDAQFSNSGLGNQMFPGQVDTLTGLSANMAGLNIGGPGNSAFNFGNALNNLVSTPASPSRLLAGGPSNSPFPLMPLNPANANIARMAQTTSTDKLQNMGSQAFPDMVQAVSKEVEDEANSYFQRIYNHPPHPTLSIDDVLDMLQRFQESPNRRERDVYQCMLRNLFEEYKFFPQYPDKELQVTAQLFGGMVERNLVTTYVALGLALRCVLDALKKPEGTKMYYFGITALDRFKNRLHLYPKYCEHVHTIPHFNEFPPQLIEYVEYGAQGQEPPNKIQGPVIMPTTLPQQQPTPAPTTALYRSSSIPSSLAATATAAVAKTGTQPAITQPPRVKSIANATNIDTLLVATQDREEKIVAPPDVIQDKTAFIFNNLSQLNLPQKCEEIKEIIIKDYYSWISQYLVLKRASIEVNFHVLYSNFLDSLKIPEINKLVTKETFRNIKVLLRSDKGIANFSDRSLLKNLGHWLGMMTLGKNRPILQIDIDMKSLLVEAYNKGQQELLYVVPFVAKVLESCAKSKVFKPPNPWTMAIMNVLAELHQEPDLKLNLKFEIEVLCKNLNIDVADLKPAIYLKDPERALHIEYQLSQPKLQKDTPMSNIQVVEDPGAPPISSPANQIMDPSCVTSGAPDPRYHYSDIVTNFQCIQQLITFSPNIILLQTHPHLKQIIKSAIERTITDYIPPVVERSVKIASKTCEQIIRKDFALDPDEHRMQTAAHNLARNLAAGMAMITCRDQLLQSIQSNIKLAVMTALTPQQKEVADAAAVQLANDNMELVLAFIQKKAIESVTPEMDKLLATDIEMRKLARREGKRYCDSSVLTYQAERMPEQIRLKVGGVTSQQLAVYEEFARNIPGFLPVTERDNLYVPKIPETIPVPAQFPTGVVSNAGSFAADEMGVLYDELANKMDTFIKSAHNIPSLQGHCNMMHTLLESLIVARSTRDNMTACNLLNKAVEGLFEGMVNASPENIDQLKLYRDIHLRVMRLLQDVRVCGLLWTNKAIARYMLECREEIRYNIEATDLLISSNFVNMSQYDMMLVTLMENGTNYLSVAFAMQLVQTYFIDERANSPIAENDLLNTIDLLARLAQHPRAPEGLAHLIEMLRTSHDPNTFLVDRAIAGPTSYIHSGIVQARSADIEDPPGFAERTEYLLKDWITIYHTQAAGRDPIKAFSAFVTKMNVYGILKGDEPLTRFFRYATQCCIDLTYRHLSDPNTMASVAKTKIFQWIDAYVRLIALLVKHSGESGNSNTKLNLLNKVLGIIVGTLLQDQEVHGTSFQQVGYHRMFIMLFLELNAHDPVLENISLSVITAFCHTFHILRPSNAPAFCYSWLELISHRVFIGRILAMIPQQKGWSMYSQLLIDLFKYLAPFLRNAELAKPVQHLYKGTLRVLLVLLHDFPEFLCDYHFGFCDVIPPNCIQMRNLILSAYPRNMRLPDPFTPNLKVDMLTEVGGAPRIFTNYAAAIQPANFKKDLDSYLKARAPVTFLSELRGNLQISNDPGSRYNIPLMNALVLYVGTQAIAHVRSKNMVPTMTTIVHSAHMDIFQNLAVDLDNEGRYLFLNAIANQLRYPNSHTHYFSCAILYLFVEANSEAIQEQITRVLLERLIVNRPHPWGLLITFIELIKNPAYKFWEHDFVHCAPEIEKLFESVARSCMVVKSNNQPQIPNVEPEVTL